MTGKMMNLKTREVLTMEEFTALQEATLKEWYENSMELQMEFPSVEIFIAEMKKTPITNGWVQI